MEKKDLVFLAASDATFHQFNGNTQEDKETIKKCFRTWHQIFSELYSEIPKLKKEFDFMATF
ncbi:MAG: hypothetical protein P4L42_10130 [Desulfocapsaceae bacterium]|nr:hypothetical protein [Desulfocapsaceae bacterium]